MNQKREEESASVENSRKITTSPKTKGRTNTTNIHVPVHSKMKTKSRRPNGRLGKRKTRKTIRIKSLDAIDFLHNETLLSTAPKGSGEKSPPPPGCVDYEFTSLTSLAASTVPIHTELPPATYETPYSLQILLDLYREQFLGMIRCMKSDDFRKNVEIQIIDEKEKKGKLTAKLEQLEKQITLLIGDSLKLLRTRMTELGITNGYNAKDLMAKAKEIMSQHHELQGEAFKLNYEIPVLQGETTQLLNKSLEDDNSESSELQIRLSSCFPDSGDVSAFNEESSVLQVKSEPLDVNSEEDKDEIPSSEFRVQLNVVDFKVEPQLLAVNSKDESPRIKPEPMDFSVTPCSIVLPRIVDGPKLKLLTPAQKKFAYTEPQFNTAAQNSPTDSFSLNNENKPPTEKQSSSHKHRHKRSHKSKRKRRHQIILEQPESNFMKPAKVELVAIPSYSKMTNHMITDPIEDIITKTLNDNSGNSYSPQTSSAVVTAVPNYSSNGTVNGGCSEKTDHSDYRRVPPMKIALKKFVQENRDLQTTLSPSVMRTTVGDLVSSEIEKSLEISNRNTVNQLSVPFDYNAVHSRLMSKRSSGERRETYNYENYEQMNSRSPFSTPTYVMPSPSHSSTKNSPKTREEPFEGLAASMFSAVTSCRSSEADSSRHSTPYCTPPMNLEFKMNEPNLVPIHLCSNSSSSSAMRLPVETSSSIEPKSHGDGNKWQEVSLCFDRMFEFVSNKIDSQENVPTLPSKDKLKCRMRDSIAGEKHSPTFALNPPPLFRADSSFSESPPMPDLPVSPASLEGPFSPVPSLSPPALSSPISSSNVDSKGEYCNYSEKFRPKGKGWKWP